jgi:hypothetical protein
MPSIILAVAMSSPCQKPMHTKNSYTTDETVSFDNPIFAKTFKKLLQRSMSCKITQLLGRHWHISISCIRRFWALTFVSNMTPETAWKLLVGCCCIGIQIFSVTILSSSSMP